MCLIFDDSSQISRIPGFRGPISQILADSVTFSQLLALFGQFRSLFASFGGFRAFPGPLPTASLKSTQFDQFSTVWASDSLIFPSFPTFPENLRPVFGPTCQKSQKWPKPTKKCQKVPKSAKSDPKVPTLDPQINDDFLRSNTFL
jgi:hypothetical protein